ALYPAARLGHVGVGIDALLAPLRQYLGIADQRRDGSALGVENAHPMVAPIAHVDIAIGVDGDVGWVIELVGPGITSLLAVGLNIRAENGHRVGALGLLDCAICAARHQALARGRQFLDAVALPISDV